MVYKREVKVESGKFNDWCEKNSSNQTINKFDNEQKLKCVTSILCDKNAEVNLAANSLNGAGGIYVEIPDYTILMGDYYYAVMHEPVEEGKNWHRTFSSRNWNVYYDSRYVQAVAGCLTNEQDRIDYIKGAQTFFVNEAEEIAADKQERADFFKNEVETDGANLAKSTESWLKASRDCSTYNPEAEAMLEVAKLFGQGNSENSAQ